MTMTTTLLISKLNMMSIEELGDFSKNCKELET
jgi:hypothetical protein